MVECGGGEQNCVGKDCEWISASISSTFSTVKGGGDDGKGGLGGGGSSGQGGGNGAQHVCLWCLCMLSILVKVVPHTHLNLGSAPDLKQKKVDAIQITTVLCLKYVLRFFELCEQKKLYRL